MYLDIEFLTSLAGTGEYGLPKGGGRIFDNDRNDRFLVRCREFSTIPATAVAASKAIRLRRFKDELIIFMIFRGKFASILRIDSVEKVKRNFSLVKQIFPAEAIGHSARASLRPLKHPCRPPAGDSICLLDHLCNPDFWIHGLMSLLSRAEDACPGRSAQSLC